jgi:hypothetical protein
MMLRAIRPECAAHQADVLCGKRQQVNRVIKLHSARRRPKPAQGQVWPKSRIFAISHVPRQPHCQSPVQLHEGCWRIGLRRHQPRRPALRQLNQSLWPQLKRAQSSGRPLH